MTVHIKVLGPEDADALANVAPGVFDYGVDPEATREFLADERHHIVVALDEGTVVGFASCLHYVHPDKPTPQLWSTRSPWRRPTGDGASLRRL